MNEPRQTVTPPLASGSRQAKQPSLRRVLLTLLGLLLLALALPPFFNFPLVHFWFLPLAAVYLFMLLVLPRLWLVVLPVAAVTLDLSPWTGRFAYGTFDLVVLMTLVSGLIYNRFRYKVYTTSPAMLVLGCFLLIVALGCHAWPLFLIPPQASWDNPYYSGEYAYNAVKGIVWGVALVPMWGYLLAVDKRRAVNTLLVGASLAAICLGLEVLWELGHLGLFFNGVAAAYHDSLSPAGLASAYHATGFFAEMRTGGHVTDGVLLLLLPATLHAITWGLRLPIRLLGAAGLLALVYVMLMGLPPTSALAFVLGMAIYIGLLLWERRMTGISAGLPLRWLVACCVAVAFLALLTHGFKKSDTLTGVEIEAAAAQGHWQEVVDSVRGGVWQQLFGNGVGQFPARFKAAHPEQLDVVGNFSVSQREGREVLRIEGGLDLNLGQRVTIVPRRTYTFDLRYRTLQSDTLEVALCERNILYTDTAERPCVHQTLQLEATGGGFGNAQMEFDSGQTGSGAAIGRWPTQFSLKYPSAGQVLEIDALHLTLDGSNLLRNSSFTDGVDHWFYFNDGSHSAWHIDNQLLQVWFETGWLGLGLFLSLVCILVHATLGPHDADSLAPVYMTGVATILLLGLFASPLESARVSWLFYFFLAAGLARLRPGGGAGRNKPARRYAP